MTEQPTLLQLWRTCSIMRFQQSVTTTLRSLSFTSPGNFLGISHLLFFIPSDYIKSNCCIFWDPNFHFVESPTFLLQKCKLTLLLNNSKILSFYSFTSFWINCVLYVVNDLLELIFCKNEAEFAAAASQPLLSPWPSLIICLMFMVVRIWSRALLMVELFTDLTIDATSEVINTD